MNKRFPVLTEMARALVVLALVLLNLTATAPAMANGPGYQSSEIVWQCGFADAPDHADHAPCHACGYGADAELPAPPAVASRMRIEPAGTLYRPFLAYRPHRLLALAHRSRGPPPKA